jgi:hypothetical protein
MELEADGVAGEGAAPDRILTALALKASLYRTYAYLKLPSNASSTQAARRSDCISDCIMTRRAELAPAMLGY